MESFIYILVACGIGLRRSSAGNLFCSVQGPDTFQDAFETCALQSRNLLTVKSRAKLDEVKTCHLKHSVLEIWLGLSPSATSTCQPFRWSDGSVVTNDSWTMWKAPQPQNCNRTTCIKLSSAGWKTERCDAILSFLCEEKSPETGLNFSTTIPDQTSVLPQQSFQCLTVGYRRVLSIDIVGIQSSNLLTKAENVGACAKAAYIHYKQCQGFVFSRNQEQCDLLELSSDPTVHFRVKKGDTVYMRN